MKVKPDGQGFETYLAQRIVQMGGNLDDMQRSTSRSKQLSAARDWSSK